MAWYLVKHKNIFTFTFWILIRWEILDQMSNYQLLKTDPELWL
jgi:hypothetical protein